jgi:hypothetical protein
MGCVESIPVSANDLARPHPINKNLPPVSKKIEPDLKPLVLYMPKDKCSGWGLKGFDIARPNGVSFRGVTAHGESSGRNVFALFDTDHRLLAACLIMYTGGPRYKIYIPQPVFPGQSPSKQVYKGGLLYCYAEVTRSQVTLTSAGSLPYFTVQGTERRRVVTRNGVIAAAIEAVSEKWGRNPRHQVSVCPGIDPILLLCLAGIYNHLNYCDQRRKSDD